jgi:hypothetical protein
MNPLIKTLVLGGAVLAGAIYAFDAHTVQVTKLDLDGQRARLRAAYVERMSFAYSLPSNERYRDEFASATKWYEAELADLYNRHPGAAKDADAALKELEAQEKAGKVKADQAAGKKEFIEITRGFYQLIKSGKYAPVYSTPMYGIRFDVLSMRRESYEGRSRVRIDAVVWGAPRREMVSKDAAGKAGSVKVSLDFLPKKLGFEFVDAKQKLVGGGETGAPTFLVDFPERFIPDFPPQAALAVWYVDPFPREAATVTMKVDCEIRSPAGAPVPFSITSAFPTPEELKLLDGEKFEGEERVMPEEDLNRANK